MMDIKYDFKANPFKEKDGIGDQLGVQPLFPRLVLKEGGVVGAHAEVDVDAVCQRAERVVGAELAETGFCHGGDLPHPGEAAAEQDVRLQQIHGVQRQQALPRIGVEDLLAGGQRNVQALRHFGPCFQIVRADRLLHKEGTVGFDQVRHSAALPRLIDLALHVDADLKIGTKGVPHPLKHLHEACFGGTVGEVAEALHADLAGLVAILLDLGLQHFQRGLAVLAHGVAVNGHAVPHSAYHLVHRQVGDLSGNVPQRQIDGAGRRIKDAAAGKARVVQDPLLDPLPVQRVHADDPLGDILDHLGRGLVGTDAEQLAHAVDALVGVDPDKVEITELGGMNGIRRDFSDLHVMYLFYSVIQGLYHGEAEICHNDDGDAIQEPQRQAGKEDVLDLVTARAEGDGDRGRRHGGQHCAGGTAGDGKDDTAGIHTAAHTGDDGQRDQDVVGRRVAHDLGQGRADDIEGDHDGQRRGVAAQCLDDELCHQIGCTGLLHRSRQAEQARQHQDGFKVDILFGFLHVDAAKRTEDQVRDDGDDVHGEGQIAVEADGDHGQDEDDVDDLFRLGVDLLRLTGAALVDLGRVDLDDGEVLPADKSHVQERHQSGNEDHGGLIEHGKALLGTVGLHQGVGRDEVGQAGADRQHRLRSVGADSAGVQKLGRLHGGVLVQGCGQGQQHGDDAQGADELGQQDGTQQVQEDDGTAAGALAHDPVADMIDQGGLAQRTGQNEHGTDHDNVGAGEVGVCVLEAQHTGGAQERGTEHADPAEIELAAQEHDHDHKQCDKGQDQMDTHNRFTPLTFIGFGYSSPEFAWDFRLIFACNCW